MKQVSKEKYLEFVRNYPSKLMFNCITICEPPIGEYHDFNISDNISTNVVAREIRSWMGSDGGVDNSRGGRYWEYYIRQE